MSGRRRGRRNRGVSTPVKLIVLLVIFACALTLFLVSRSADKKERAVIAQGRERLREIDTDEALLAAENAVKKQRREGVRKRLEEELENDGKIDPWSYLGDAVILGGTQTTGFSSYGFMPQGRVLAADNHTITSIEKEADAMHALNPSVIILSYGYDDVASGQWKSADEWVLAYAAQIKELKQSFPQAAVCVSSVLPISDKAAAAGKNTKSIEKYGEVLHIYRAEHHIAFADCGELTEDQEQMLEEDGIHYKQSFYRYWATALVKAAYKQGGDDDSE